MGSDYGCNAAQRTAKEFVERFYQHGYWGIRLVDVQRLNGYSNADRIVSVLSFYSFVEGVSGLTWAPRRRFYSYETTEAEALTTGIAIVPVEPAPATPGTPLIFFSSSFFGVPVEPARDAPVGRMPAATEVVAVGSRISDPWCHL